MTIQSPKSKVGLIEKREILLYKRFYFLIFLLHIDQNNRMEKYRRV